MTTAVEDPSAPPDVLPGARWDVLAERARAAAPEAFGRDGRPLNLVESMWSERGRPKPVLSPVNGRLLTHLPMVVADMPLTLKMVSSRGTKVYTPMGAMTDYVDHWRCRFVPRGDHGEPGDELILAAIARIASVHRWMHVEKLQEFDGEPAYTKAQGED